MGRAEVLCLTGGSIEREDASRISRRRRKRGLFDEWLCDALSVKVFQNGW